MGSRPNPPLILRGVRVPWGFTPRPTPGNHSASAHTPSQGPGSASKHTNMVLVLKSRRDHSTWDKLPSGTRIPPRSTPLDPANPGRMGCPYLPFSHTNKHLWPTHITLAGSG